MFTTIKFKNKKLSMMLTGTSANLPISIEKQLEFIDSWAKLVPKVIVLGDKEPNKANGVRWVKTNPNPPLRNILGTYMVQIPGAEVCSLTSPDTLIGGNVAGVLEYVDSQKMELAWAAYCYGPNKEAPSLFIMSAAVVPHIMRDIPATLTFGDPAWKKWLHEWMKKLLPVYRYFDATPFGLIPPPIVNAYDIPIPADPEPEAPKIKKKAKKAA